MRTRQEIDAEYTEAAKNYGDKQFRLTYLQREVNDLFTKMTQLAQEPAAPPAPPVVEDSPEKETPAAPETEKVSA